MDDDSLRKATRTGKTVVGRMARGTESKKGSGLATRFNLVAMLASSYHHLPKPYNSHDSLHMTTIEQSYMQDEMRQSLPFQCSQ